MSSSRRDLLAAFGIGIPASLLEAPTLGKSATVSGLSGAEIYKIYVENYIRSLPPQVIKDRNSVHVAFARSHAFALAAVLTELQNKQDLSDVRSSH